MITIGVDRVWHSWHAILALPALPAMQRVSLAMTRLGIAFDSLGSLGIAFDSLVSLGTLSLAGLLRSEIIARQAPRFL